jgi:hypothetical protein
MERCMMKIGYCKGTKLATWQSPTSSELLCATNSNFCERYHIGDLGVDGRIILKQFLHRMEGYGLNLSVHGRDKWQAVIHTIVNFKVS